MEELMRHCIELDGHDHLIWLSRTADGYVLHFDGGDVAISLDNGLLRAGDSEGPVHVAQQGDRLFIHWNGAAHELLFKDAVQRHAAGSASGSDDTVRAPMPGAVVGVSSEAGQAVREGDILLVIESMKLETAIRASRDGVVEAVHVTLSQSFERDAPLVTLAPLGEEA
ncbi:acetyl-CoA carboxylase biotin carboxyl carrier protein subunit [Thauera propionica]|uniref:acetyl-CoA carboxylase biotin carboxyl carrier protein subunit n=1 Tax=Thauera propionica TaxID=2019431 RepID=UPI0023F12577|nr:biotin/lipoyl-containing protein [Thauera propionica]MDD3674805.1 biotin/lipoyl-binding protein [Thauera propionica]